MFLAFLSMSFVALALVAQALPVYRDVLPVAAVVLAFDLVVGLTTYPPTSGLGAIVYQLTTSATMIGLIVSMIGGVLAGSRPWPRSGCSPPWPS